MTKPRPAQSQKPSRGTSDSPRGGAAVRAAFWTTASILRPLMNLVLSRKWINTDKLQVGRGVIVCANHCTEIDPIIVGHMLYSNKVPPHFLAKASLFRTPVVKQVLSAARQIPVDREGPGGGRSLQTAQAVLDDGGAIVIYPEGTLTKDPELWPMKGRTGAARLALRTGAPVIPVAHWGGQELLPPYARKLSLFPRKHVRVIVGDPVDLSAFQGKPITRELLSEVTEAILTDITALLAELRGEDPPAERWDPAAQQRRDDDSSGGKA